MKSIHRIIAIGVLLTNFSCEKFVQVDPPVTSVVGESVYATNSTAAAALTGIYITMAGNSIGGGNSGISILAGLSADELKLYPLSINMELGHIYINALLSTDGSSVWTSLYKCIFQANSSIEGISASTSLTPAISTQLMGEAKFVRAFCFFYLVNLYGDIPLTLTTDYKVNAIIQRSPKEQVYQQIITDLKDAQSLLSNDYLTPGGAITTTRVRPNKVTVSALLARVYLYLQQWDKAEIEATSVIDNPNYSLLTNLNNVFLATSNEAIWQLEMPSNGFNTRDGATFMVPFNSGGPAGDYPTTLSDSLAMNFEPGDLRKANWVTSLNVGSVTYYYPYKYKLNAGNPATEYPVIFRLAEQFLIRAEARAKQDNIEGAKDDLNAIRTRAGLPNTLANTQASLISAIQNERRFELFTEYGHRWFDLKRTGSIDDVMTLATPQKGGTWLTTASLYPIPLTEIQVDPNLTQNPGYN